MFLIHYIYYIYNVCILMQSMHQNVSKRCFDIETCKKHVHGHVFSRFVIKECQNVSKHDDLHVLMQKSIKMHQNVVLMHYTCRSSCFDRFHAKEHENGVYACVIHQNVVLMHNTLHKHGMHVQHALHL